MINCRQQIDFTFNQHIICSIPACNINPVSYTHLDVYKRQAYNYYILNVDLENFNLSHVPVYIMGEEQLSMYAMYMSVSYTHLDVYKRQAPYGAGQHTV